MIWIAFGVGVVIVGIPLGILVGALCRAAGEARRNEDMLSPAWKAPADSFTWRERGDG